MRIAVLSGKGGTGKTLISVNLAAAAGSSAYIDCDVEEPNGYLFFKPPEVEEEEISVKIPKVDGDLCNGCRKCVEFCNFNALAYIKDQLLVFEEICHSCGGCVLVCPEKALEEKGRIIGKIQRGKSCGVEVYTGIMNTGEASGVPIINKLMQNETGGPVFIDCPPGSACVVMESIKDADYCILVAEPTLFGAHNLAMVYELVKLFGKDHGVVLNKCIEGDNPSETFCIENGIEVLMRIPFDRQLGILNSNGKIAVEEDEKYRSIFTGLLQNVNEIVKETEKGDSKK